MRVHKHIRLGLISLFCSSLLLLSGETALLARPCGSGFFSKVGCGLDPFNPARNGGVIQPVADALVPTIISDNAWGAAGSGAYRASAEVMLMRNPPARRLDEQQRQQLRPYFGDLVDQVAVHYDSMMMDKWNIMGKEYNFSGVDTIAQTFCDNIYIAGPYLPTDRLQSSKLAHEMMHFRQCRKLGGLEAFGFHYFREFKRADTNYENNKLEMEATELEKQYLATLR